MDLVDESDLRAVGVPGEPGNRGGWGRVELGVLEILDVVGTGRDSFAGEIENDYERRSGDVPIHVSQHCKFVSSR